MISVFFELELLRTQLLKKGLDEDTVSRIVDNAKNEIERTISEDAQSAMDAAIEAGVQKRSAEFINDLKFNDVTLKLNTASNNTDFSEPPFPMLPHLLKNAKPMKDGSGVYKIIPVGGESKTGKPSIASNIYDQLKRQRVEQLEAAENLKRNSAPRGSKVQFRTATSKQDSSVNWVRPEQEKDFSETLQEINDDLTENLEQKIRSIIRDIEESF